MRLLALVNLLLSPFLLLFLLAFFFMRNAERLYHHPSSLGARRWWGHGA
jgi:autophagy-related protein 9